MQAVILAGGLGTRLRPLTHTIPKPMVPVAGVPYLEHQLRLLRRQGICDVVLLVGYLGELVEEYFGDGGALDLRLRYSREPAPLGTGGALRYASDLVDETFLLLYGDSFLPIAYEQPLRMLEDFSAEAVVVVYDNRCEDTGVASNIALEPDGLVSRYDKGGREAADLRYVEAGVLALRRTVVDLIPADGPVSLENEIYPQLIRRRAVRALVTSQRFYDIGTPDRLERIERYLKDDYHAHAVSH